MVNEEKTRLNESVKQRTDTGFCCVLCQQSDVNLIRALWFSHSQSTLNACLKARDCSSTTQLHVETSLGGSYQQPSTPGAREKVERQ
jgi:hypothetical protein